MNITSEKHSLLRLWLESFAVINRCTGRLMALLIIWLFFVAVLAGIVVICAMFASFIPKQVISLGVSILYIYTCLLMVTVFFRSIAATATDPRQPLFSLLSESVVPAFWLAIACLIFTPLFILNKFLLMIPGGAVLVALVFIVLFFTIGVRLAYTWQAIVLKNQGPIEGFLYSMKLTDGHYADTLLMMIMTMLTNLLIQVVIFALGIGIYKAVPLYFANSFSFKSPLWWAIGLVVAIICALMYLIPIVFPVLVFINRDSIWLDARHLNAAQQDNVFVPLPDLELPDIRPNPEHAQQEESTLRAPALTEADLRPTQPAPQPAPAAQPASQSQPATQQPQATPSLEGLGVSQSSINTSEEDTNTITQHLDQVYTPKEEDIIQYGDEDRMPTILFDDEMAKQLQQNQAQFAPKPKDDNGPKDNGPDTIKMSKF